MNAELIYNPRGGQVALRHEIDDVITFLRRSGWTIDLRETSRPMEATGLARAAARRGAQVVIAAGGDGTINEVANGLLNTDVALGVLPMGTTNSWALQMGIPALKPVNPGTQVIKLISDLEERTIYPLPNYFRKLLLDAARVLVEGRTVAVDVGEVGGRCFLMWSGVGLDATILESISLKEKKALGSWAYVFNAIQLGSRSSGTDIYLNLDGSLVVKTNSPLVVVSNIQLYGGIMAIGARACVNDGKLDVCIFKGDGFFTFVQHAMNILSHRHLRDPKVEYYQCREIDLDSSHPLPVHVDGEPFTNTPITIRTLPSSLRVIIPKVVPGNLFC
jgi:diacylglycerol kinase (ATP)